MSQVTARRRPSWRNFVGRILAGLSSAGISPQRALTLRFLPRYLAQRRRFARLGGRIDHTYAILEDYRAQAGSTRGHYFHQDLLVASAIHDARPVRHVDVGSRIDGFIAHVASFRKVEVIDIRPLSDAQPHPNISFVQGDLMEMDGNEWEGVTDSLSCLHALEHFGLGRYGDALDPRGHLKGFLNLHRLLKPGGTLYLSFPIKSGPTEIYFNAHRVFDATEPLAWSRGLFELSRFDFIDDHGGPHTDTSISVLPADTQYACGIYTLRKL